MIVVLGATSIIGWSAWLYSLSGLICEKLKTFPKPLLTDGTLSDPKPLLTDGTLSDATAARIFCYPVVGRSKVGLTLGHAFYSFADVSDGYQRILCVCVFSCSVVSNSL